MGKNDFLSPKAVSAEFGYWATWNGVGICCILHTPGAPIFLFLGVQIANRIKSKGLQKLRWYCQMCQKQCRDENGFQVSLDKRVAQTSDAGLRRSSRERYSHDAGPEAAFSVQVFGLKGSPLLCPVEP